jgi:hypothetical protein
MRSIDRLFIKIKLSNPYQGDILSLFQTVRGKKFTRKAIRKFFLEWIKDNDYDREDLKTLIDQLHIASNMLVDVHFDTKIALLSGLNLEDETLFTSTK